MRFETLVQELDHSTGMIRSLVEGMDASEARQKPGAGSWSMLEVICHLYDEEREDFREHLDFILHRQNEEWHTIDPQNWVTARSYNDQDFEEAKERFFRERKNSLEWLKGLSGSNWDTTYSSEYGAISAGAMLASWIAHDNLHIRQLVELRRHRIENITQPYPVAYAGDW